jgi:hypothetical protein
MVSLKSGPFTINDTMAHRMAANVKALQQYGVEPVVYGVTYGTRKMLSNKPDIVKGDFPDDKVAILAGREFWDWLAQYKNAHLDIFNGIADGEKNFIARTNVSFIDQIKQKKADLTAAFVEKFKIAPGDDVWQRLTETGF